MEKCNITVAGIGYVGLSNGILLADRNDVVFYDIDKNKVEKIKNKVSPIDDHLVQQYLAEKDLSIEATNDKKIAFSNADFVIISTPTDYNVNTKYFNTSSIESVIKDVSVNTKKKVCVIIKSTIPTGFTENISKKYKNIEIIFSPEFLREGNALYDNLYPSRIIIGSKSENAKKFVGLLENSALKKEIIKIFTGSHEAEAIKLFANTYLAMRVGYINEIDNYAISHNLNCKDIIEGMCLDPRIGQGYNNPSFGYGGYCLPKDTKQLKANFLDIPESLISAIVETNDKRIDFIAKQIIDTNKKTIGIYRLIMKAGSDNYRMSSIIKVIEIINRNGINVVIYEPSLNDKVFFDAKVINDFKTFIDSSEIIVTNRIDDVLKTANKEIFTRDIFGID